MPRYWRGQISFPWGISWHYILQYILAVYHVMAVYLVCNLPPRGCGPPTPNPSLSNWGRQSSSPKSSSTTTPTRSPNIILVTRFEKKVFFSQKKPSFLELDSRTLGAHQTGLSPPSRRSAPAMSRFHPVLGWRTIPDLLERRVVESTPFSVPNVSWSRAEDDLVQTVANV